MLLTVVVPVYNVEKYLEKCVDSIINQTYRELEIILVDDGSIDNSADICDELATKDERIVVIHQNNQGLSAARNTGILNAHGEYIGFVDSDDYLCDTMYEKMMDKAINNDLDMCAVGFNDIYDNFEQPKMTEHREYLFSGEEVYKETMIGLLIPVSVCVKIFKHEIFDKVMFAEGKYYEDAFFLSSVMPFVNSAWITTEALYNYVHRFDSITTKEFNKKHLDVIEAYDRNYEVVMSIYPSLKDEAIFRRYWSYFVVLDKLLTVDGYKKYDEYYDVLSFLKKNAINISKNNYFAKSRRISALLLAINVNFYKIALFIKNKKDRVVE